jgi:Zn-dependent protease
VDFATDVWDEGDVETERLDLRPMTFRANARKIGMRAVFVFAAAALAGAMVELPLGLLLLGGFVVGLGYYAVAWAVQVASYGIRVDSRGVHRLDPRGDTTIPWSELLSLDLAETPVRVRERPVRLRYIVVEGRGTTRILFADLSSIGSPAVRIELDGIHPITDVADSGVLLAVLADRIGDDRYLPGVLMDHSTEHAARREAENADRAGEEREDEPRPEKRRVSFGALLVLLAKIGTKIAKGIPVALKTFKPGLVLASAALYSILLTWQFALAMVVMLAFHEYGHVHAMRRAGLKVRGIYFIPMLGAAAVTEDTWRTRREQADIALSGPIWGLGLTVVAAIVDAATGYAYPLAGVIVAWWALVNLFNLLPINPLDGGRVLSAIGYSLHGTIGALISVGSFVAALAIAWFFDVTLLAIVGAIGLLEFAGEAAATMRFRRLNSSPRIAQLSATGLATLKGLARPSLGEEADQAYFHMELRNASRLRQMARVVPMTRGQMIRWGVAYVVVTAALLALLVLASAAHPDAAIAREILR